MGRPAPHVVVVTVAGEIDAFTAPRLVDALRAATAEAPEHVILDLQLVTFSSSAGVNALITSREYTARRGVDLHLVGVPGNRWVTRVLDLTGLTAQFTTHPTVIDALVEIRRS
jgi:anti-sigma B factor antagonist